jgi:Ca2+-binding EF-hand superfamily protein
LVAILYDTTLTEWLRTVTSKHRDCHQKRVEGNYQAAPFSARYHLARHHFFYFFSSREELISLYVCTAHSREQARKQIDAGQKISGDDKEIRRVFEEHAETSEEMERYAHIPKKWLLAALGKLEIEIGEDAVDDFFEKNDLDGNGLFDYEEFKQAILAPLSLPPQHEIRRVFDAHSEKLSTPEDNAFINSTKISVALQNLGLKMKTVEKVLAYFNQAPSADGQISFEEFNQAILSISPLPDEQEVTRVYHEHAVPGKYRYIPSHKLELALQDLGAVATKDQLAHYNRIVNLNFNGCIKYHAFKHIVLSPSPVEVWAKTLPLSRLLADALPKLSDCDHLRVISSLTIQEAEIVAEEMCAALKEVLVRHVGQLKSSFQAMDQQVLKDEAHANSKFDVTKMTAGSIQHFYEGLEGRIGIFHPFLI